MDSRQCVARALLTIAFAVGSGGWVSSASGQVANAEKQVVNIFLPAPRELAQRLVHAKKAIELEEYADAVTQLGRLLMELEDQPAVDSTGVEQPQDYFIGPRGDEGTHTSLKTEAQRLIGSMPAKGREWYELQFGAAARALLEDGINDNDAAKLTSVSRRFFHTKAGYEATMLLGRHYMDRGQPLAAALSFKRIADSPSADTFEPELSLLLSTCWLHANLPEKAQQTLVDLQKRKPNSKWRLGNDPVQLPGDQQQALPWFEKIVGAARRAGIVDTLQWILFRGNATRNALSQGDMPLSKARWRVPTVNDPNEEKIVGQAEKRMVSSNTPSLPIFQPLAVKDMILMRTPDLLLGVDFRTGKRIWPFPWDEMEVTPAVNQTTMMRVSGAQGGASQKEMELRQRIWEDAPYGQFSSDGEAVYLIHGLRFASPNMGFQPFIVGPNGRVMGARGNMTSNKLVALDLKREGSYRWVIGDDQGGGGDEPKLAGAFFLGAPLPLQGQLFVLAEINAEIRLVVLNARTGKLDWQQQIAHLETRNILVDAQRRLAGASPSYADGVLVCPTSAGAVVAVDVATRTLLWGYQYNQATTNSRQGIVFRNGVPMQQRAYGNRWADATVTIHDGRVVVTPVESDDLYCVDLLTGKLAWPAKKRDEMMYVAGIFEGNLVMVGRRHVSAFKLATGEPAWPAPIEIPDGASPSGRGILTKGYYYLPTSGSQLVKIDTQAGKIAEAIRTERVLGNLICYRDEIISQGTDGVSTYHMVAPLREKVSEALRKNANDGWALARLGELLLYDGKQAESLDTLRRAYELNPGDESLRSLLVSTLLTVLREDFARARNLAPEIERLATLPTQRAEFLRLMAEGMKKAGETEAAFTAFLNLAGIQQSLASGGAAVPPTEQITRTYAVRRDRWLQSNLAEIYVMATPEQRQKMDASIEQLRQQVDASPDVTAGRHFLRYFSFHGSADRVRLELAARLIDSDTLLEAELLLASLESHPNRAVAGAAVAETARLLARGRQWEQAAEYFTRLQRDYSDVVCRGGQSGAQRFAEASQDAALKKALDGISWPYGQAEMKETDNRALANASYGRSIQLLLRDATGATPSGLTVAYDLNRNQMLTVRDGFGRELLQAQITRPDQRLPYFFNNTQQMSQVRARGHLLVMNLGLEMVAVSTLRNSSKTDEPVRWRHDASPPSTDPARAMPQFRTSITSTPWGFNRFSVTLANEDAPVGAVGPITSHAVFFQKYRELVAADLLTGEVLWSRGEFPAGCELFGDDELLFVVPPKSNEATVLNALDGRELGKRKIDPLELRWVTSGRRVLSWSQTGNFLGLKLTDAWTGKVLYEANHASGSRGATVGYDELATLAPDGTFKIFSLIDGQPRVQAKVDPEPSLMSISVQRGNDQYILATNRPQPASSGTVDYSQIPGATTAPLFTGNVYAFDRRSGHSLWPSPAVVEQYGMPSDQPTDVPVLVFLRNVRPRGRNTAQTSLLCIDKRDGRVLLSKDDVPVQSNFYDINGDIEKKTVTVQLGVKIFTLQLTNGVVPPEPPVQTGTASSLTSQPQANTRGLITAIEDEFDAANGGGARINRALPRVAPARVAAPRAVPLPAGGIRIQRALVPMVEPVEIPAR